MKDAIILVTEEIVLNKSEWNKRIHVADAKTICIKAMLLVVYYLVDKHLY